MELAINKNLAFNYLDIFFTYHSVADIKCVKMIKEHTLVYVYSGELLVEEKERKIEIHSGECVFLRRDNRVSMTKQPRGQEMFQAIFMIFNRNFLRGFYQTLDKKQLPLETEKHEPSTVKLPQTPDITSLFQSMTPYFDTSIKPSDEIMKLKLYEGVYALLNIDKRFYPGLFDFTEPWKIDIFDFLNENYSCDLSMEEIAGFTGRSLATFKRDFKKISPLPPQKWLIEKRLETAYDKIFTEKKKVSDVYLEVGFKNLSHFSSAFKKQYGHSPTK